MKKAKEKGNGFKEELKGRLQKAQSEVENEGLKKVSLTDPESRFMKTKGSKIELSYNPQVTVDRNGFILASDVNQNASDAEQLQPQVLQTKENIGEFPKQVIWSFDAGYFRSENIGFLAEKKVDGYIPDRNAKKATNPFDKSNFVYNAVLDEYTCPENQKVTFLREHYDTHKKKVIRMYRGQGCLLCQKQSACTRRRNGIRYLKMFPHERELTAMRAKMKSPMAKEI